MNAPATFDLEAIARSVVSGTAALLPAHEHELYEFSEWQVAAQGALDGDDSELRFMLRREAQYQDFCEWQGETEDPSGRRWNPREFADFGNWADGRAA